MREELSEIERTRLALWALSEAEARVTTPPHVEAEVLRAWDAAQAERSRLAAASIVPERRFGAALAKWVVVPAMAAGMAWVALRAVAPVASSPGRETAVTARTVTTPVAPSVGEPPAAPVEAAAAVADARRAGVAERVASPASAPSQRLQSATASRTSSAVVFVGELVGAGERIQVVRMRVPRSMLASLGVSVAEGSEMVFVDLLVGEDGVARALQVEM